MRRAGAADGASITHIGAFTAVAAALTLGVLVYAGQELGPRKFAQFMVIWGTFFFVSGLWQGLQQEVTRSLSAARTGRAAGRSLVVPTVVVGATGAAVFLVLSLVLSRTSLALDGSAAVVLAVGVFAYALANGYNGALMAGGEWHLYAWVLLFEALARSAFLGIVIGFALAPSAQAGALVGGAVAWVAISAIASARRTLHARGDTDLRGFVSRVVKALAASACAVLVIAGFPVLLDLTTSGPLNADAGVLLAVVVLTRAPLLLVANALQGVLITRLVDVGAHADAELRRWLQLVMIGLLPMVAGAYLMGPPVLRLLMGDDFDATGLLFVGFSVAAISVTTTTLTGLSTIAAGQHGAYLGGWLIALVATVLILLLPISLEARSMAALITGPVLGAGVHLRALALRSTTRAPTRTLTRDRGVSRRGRRCGSRWQSRRGPC